MYVKIDGQLKTIKRIELTSNSKTILLHTATETGKEEVYICPSGSPHYYHLRKFLASEFYIPCDIVCANETSTIWMTTIFFDINDEIYIIKRLTYYFTTQSYKIDTETLGTWEKATFSCPSEPPNFAFIEGFFKNPPPTKIVSMYHAI